MRKRVFLAIVLVLLVAGCAGFQGKSKTQAEGLLREFRAGTQGVQLNFVNNLPPFRNFDVDPFMTVVEIFNRGAAEVGTAGDRVYLSGFDPGIISGIPTTGEQIPQIEGKNQFNLDGGFDTVSFRGTVRRLTSDRYPVKLVATACYNYETIASQNICVDPDPFSVTKSKVCVPQTVSTGSQGAPIAVTSVELEPRPRKTVFKINLANSGGGDVFRFGTGALQRCSPYDPQGLQFDEVDYVQLADVEVSGQSIRQGCKPLDQGHLRLTNGKGVVYCEFTPTSGSAFVTPLTVTLRYGYRTQIFKDIEIWKTP